MMARIATASQRCLEAELRAAAADADFRQPPLGTLTLRVIPLRQVAHFKAVTLDDFIILMLEKVATCD